MLRCKKCGRLGLFTTINKISGVCSICERASVLEQIDSPVHVEPLEPSIEIPTVYIGNNMKSKLIEKFEDVELQRPDSMPDFSKIDCCDDVHFVVENDVVIAKRIVETLGFVTDAHIASEIKNSLENHRPIFSQILGYDDKTGEIHLVIAFYKIVNYDYTDYVEERDKSLDDETVGYYR